MTELLAPERNKAGTAEGKQPSSASREESRHVLVVVDEPCISPELCASVRSSAGSGPVDALVIAPAHGSAATQWYVDEDAARADATRRLRASVSCLGGDGIRAEGQLGDPDPVQAITDALHVFPADEILLITAPQRPSTWLHQNAIDRARRSFEQPIEHVVMSTSRREPQARLPHIRLDHPPAAPDAATPPQSAPPGTLWERFVARAGRGLRLPWRAPTRSSRSRNASGDASGSSPGGRRN